jgi:hypothetical protein
VVRLLPCSALPGVTTTDGRPEMVSKDFVHHRVEHEAEVGGGDTNDTHCCGVATVPPIRHTIVHCNDGQLGEFRREWGRQGTNGRALTGKRKAPTRDRRPTTPVDAVPRHASGRLQCRMNAESPDRAAKRRN